VPQFTSRIDKAKCPYYDLALAAFGVSSRQHSTYETRIYFWR